MNEKSLCIGEPLPIFFHCVNVVIFQQILVIFQQIILGEPCSNLFRVGLHSYMYFKAVYNRSRPTLCFQNEWLSEFLWLHVPSKNGTTKILPKRGTLKKYEWVPWDSGNIQHCTITYTSCNSDYKLIVQPNSDKYDVFYDLTN